MIQKSCCKCQATTTIELSTIRNTTWCRQCFIDQINIKFFQGLKSLRSTVVLLLNEMVSLWSLLRWSFTTKTT
ncbi:hypothetical protein KEM48_001978 [Puccinia striiformis f. sp. tritici PST-130]|nr:hypothetical protein KEM48_001978 [Puccinia striiformis f. sp. tritici PST-130]